MRETVRLSEMETCPIRPLSQTEVKSVLSDLKDIARGQPDVAALLGTEGALKDFVVAALSLSPYLRDIARVSPDLLANAIGGPLRLGWSAKRTSSSTSAASTPPTATGKSCSTST